MTYADLFLLLVFVLVLVSLLGRASASLCIHTGMSTACEYRGRQTRMVDSCLF